MREELTRLREAVKMRNFKDLVNCWKETFELFYRELCSDEMTEAQKIWKVCGLIESIKAEQLALWVLFHDDDVFSKLIKEEYAVYILLSRFFANNSDKMTKEEFFSLLDEITANNDRGGGA
ncbi:TPA: hypothetical protein [Aquificae Conch Spring virus]|nr:TPA: hypothetical protein [Aquificae Conch Spring virus]